MMRMMIKNIKERRLLPLKTEEKGKSKMLPPKLSEESSEEILVKKVVQPLRRSQRTSVQVKLVGVAMKASQSAKGQGKRKRIDEVIKIEEEKTPQLKHSSIKTQGSEIDSKEWEFKVKTRSQITCKSCKRGTNHIKCNYGC